MILVNNPAIHNFSHFIKPILPFGVEIWGYINPSHSRFKRVVFQLIIKFILSNYVKIVTYSFVYLF
jgi:hypothetical protein